ncbi:MAG: energy transducer TonB, partial [Alistipes sp.]|nr:energy transducer TonB [Alistipes sp.]
VPDHLQIRLRIPVDGIEQALNPDPLLFQGEDPDKSFYSWMRTRVRYDERFAKVGGKVHVRFFVEPDGGITIDEVVESPDAKLTKEVLRVIRNSRGKWTPRKVDGVAQRTSYEVRINYVNESAE